MQRKPVLARAAVPATLPLPPSEAVLPLPPLQVNLSQTDIGMPVTPSEFEKPLAGNGYAT